MPIRARGWRQERGVDRMQPGIRVRTGAKACPLKAGGRVRTRAIASAGSCHSDDNARIIGSVRRRWLSTSEDRGCDPTTAARSFRRSPRASITRVIKGTSRGSPARQCPASCDPGRSGAGPQHGGGARWVSQMSTVNWFRYRTRSSRCCILARRCAARSSKRTPHRTASFVHSGMVILPSIHPMAPLAAQVGSGSRRSASSSACPSRSPRRPAQCFRAMTAATCRAFDCGGLLPQASVKRRKASALRSMGRSYAGCLLNRRWVTAQGPAFGAAGSGWRWPAGSPAGGHLHSTCSAVSRVACHRVRSSLEAAWRAASSGRR